MRLTRLFCFFFIAYLLLSASAEAQTAWLHPQLEEQLKSGDNKSIRVGLYLREQLPATALKADMANLGYSSEERARSIIREALALQARTQPALLQYLNSQKEASNLQVYYAVNLIMADVSPALIKKLRLRTEIEFIFPDAAYLTGPVEPVSATVQEGIEVVNGKEPGLVAINAPAMWNMGYTGRGRKAFTVDTGTWTDHPALKRRFLGNYRPLHESWFSLISPTPIDRPSHHGTHVNGTILGLDTATNDTLGVAFNAYFMVSNPLTTNNLTPLSINLLSFEWALNPDGDTSTVSDMPDVINNSWGQAGAADTSICSSWASQLFNVLEAAGIAITFSAGNEGPNPATVKHPQFINTNDVNIFSVGAVDGNNASLPIASFSSRGPSLCGGSGSLLIKPEVVAPGVNVRSSYGQSGYGLLSGTSMSCPHVSGSVVLLKEAFPYLGGDSLLYALYQSAIDMGATGEDNTFGRGMIDVLAAYQYLAQHHTPVPPAASAYDIAVGALVAPVIPDFLCESDGPVTPAFELLNLGDSTLTQAQLSYRIGQQSWVTQNWTGLLAAGQKTTVQAGSSLTVNAGWSELQIKVTLPVNITDRDEINNERSYRFVVRATDTLGLNNNPMVYHITADTNTLHRQEILLLNPDGGIGWDTATVSGLQRDSTAWVVRMGSYNPPDEQKDFLVTNAFFGGSAIPEAYTAISFRLAYRNRAPVYSDSLKVTLLCDCGQQQRVLYYSGGDSMKTYAGNVPLAPVHWRYFSFMLPETLLSPCLIRFETTNNFGGNLYIGDLEVNGWGNLAVGKAVVLKSLRLYPNPASQVVTISSEDDLLTRITLYDLLGKELRSWQFDAVTSAEISIRDFPAGAYVLRTGGRKGMYVNRLLKQ